MDDSKLRLAHIDCSFMYPGGPSWRGGSRELTLHRIKSYEDEPLPRTRFESDFDSADIIRVQKAYVELIKEDLAKDLWGASDPDSGNFIPIPFSEELWQKVTNQFFITAGGLLLSNSRAFREYARIWLDYEVAQSRREAREATTRAGGILKSCSGLLALFTLVVLVIAQGDGNWLGGLLLALLPGGVALYFWKLGRRRDERAIETFNELIRLELVQIRKINAFLENNPWLVDAVEEVIDGTWMVLSDSLEPLEQHFRQKRDKESDFNLYKAELGHSGAQNFSFADVQTPARMDNFHPYEYEKYCCRWANELGARKITVTQQSIDGGIDLDGPEHVGQVKMHGVPVGVPSVRQLYGVAQSVGKKALFFTTMGYTRAAIEFANENDIALFVADPVNETLDGLSHEARLALKHGLRG